MLRLIVPAEVEREFKAAAKKAFPAETFAYVLGRMIGDTVEIAELWWPDEDELEEACNTWRVNVAPHWIVEAAEAGKEQGLIPLGDLHSHPYEGKDLITDRAQSEADIDRVSRMVIGGICTVQRRQRKGKSYLRAGIRWWPPLIPMRVERE